MSTLKKSDINHRYSYCLVALTVASVGFAIFANIIGGITFPVFGGMWNFSIGGIIFPIIYVISDVISEVYGYRISRFNAWLTLGASLLVNVLLWLSAYMPVSAFAVESQLHVRALANFQTGFMATVVASVLSTVLGGYVNDIIFQSLKKRKTEMQALPREKF